MSQVVKNRKPTYSQQKRDKMDYRKEYFKHNPGIMGCVWTCAYCHRPLVGKQNVQVDHIIPLNNPLGKNARFNLVSACEKCNKEKSDKVDGRVVKGYISKAIEVIIYSLQKLVIMLIVSVWTIIHRMLAAIIWLLKIPFSDASVVTKVISVAIYVYVVYYVFHSLIY